MHRTLAGMQGTARRCLLARVPLLALITPTVFDGDDVSFFGDSLGTSLTSTPLWSHFGGACRTGLALSFAALVIYRALPSLPHQLN